MEQSYNLIKADNVSLLCMLAFVLFYNSLHPFGDVIIREDVSSKSNLVKEKKLASQIKQKLFPRNTITRNYILFASSLIFMWHFVLLISN